MAMNHSGESLRAALEMDLAKGAPGGGAAVTNDPVRKLLTFRKEGAVFEFTHRQTDDEYWCGVKYYPSGTRSRVRIKRTPVAADESGRTPRKRRSASDGTPARTRKRAAKPAEEIHISG